MKTVRHEDADFVPGMWGDWLEGHGDEILTECYTEHVHDMLFQDMYFVNHKGKWIGAYECNHGIHGMVSVDRILLAPELCMKDKDFKAALGALTFLLLSAFKISTQRVRFMAQTNTDFVLFTGIAEHLAAQSPFCNPKIGHRYMEAEPTGKATAVTTTRAAMWWMEKHLSIMPDDWQYMSWLTPAAAMNEKIHGLGDP